MLLILLILLIPFILLILLMLLILSIRLIPLVLLILPVLLCGRHINRDVRSSKTFISFAPTYEAHDSIEHSVASRSHFAFGRVHASAFASVQISSYGGGRSEPLVVAGAGGGGGSRAGVPGGGLDGEIPGTKVATECYRK